MQGEFFWYDVMTTDVTAAGDFYAKVVGWGVEEAPGDTGYRLFTVSGPDGKSRGVAGLMAIPEHAKGMPPMWMGYIAADDVDAMAARLEQEGGQIMRPPCDVPGVIRFAVVGDNQGAGFLIAKGLVAEAPPPLPITAMGNVGWRELYAGEWQSAFAFYEKLFGWTKAESYEMGPMGTYQLFATGAEPVGGMMTKPPQIPHPNWGFYFNVPAIEAAMARVKENGGTILNGPVEVPGNQWIAQALDPQGAYFGLVAPSR